MKVSFSGPEKFNFSTFNKFTDKPIKKIGNVHMNNQTEKIKENNFYKYAIATATIAIAMTSLVYWIKTKGKSSTKTTAEEPINAIKNIYNQIIEKYPNDEHYYKLLANAINLNNDEHYKLASIVGENQLSDILAKASFENFNVGENLSGVKNRTLRINLHNHTNASDGKLSIKEILEQANNWANDIYKMKGNDGKPPFVLAITDHDTIDGAKEAVKIIAKNPEKYKNLKLVLGGEFSVAHTNPKDVNSPLNFELIGYSLNPFDEKLNNFLKNLKENRKKVVKNFIEKVKEKFPEYDLNLKDTEIFHANLKNMRTNGVLYLAKEYLIHKISLTEYVNEINTKILHSNTKKINSSELFIKLEDYFYQIKDAKSYKNDEIIDFYKNYIFAPLLKSKGFLNASNEKIFNEIFEKNINDKKDFINNLLNQMLPKLDDNSGYMVRHEDFFELFKKHNLSGFLGVAHPGLINVSMFSKDVEQFCNFKGYDKGEHLGWRLYNALKKAGGKFFKATEVNYQSYPYKDINALRWQKYMGEEKANEFKLLKTGGIDCHKPSIFKKHKTLTKKEIKENNLKGIIVK